MKTFARSPSPGAGAPARLKEHQKGLQRPEYTKNASAVQSDWKERALRAYNAKPSRLSLYEIRRIFGAHFEEFHPGGAR